MKFITKTYKIYSEIDIIKKEKNIATIFIKIVLLNLFLVLVALIYIIISNGRLSPSPDAILYLQIAKSIRHFSTHVEGQLHSSGLGADIGDIIMPGYPLLISPFFENIYVIAFFQVLLFSLSLFFLLRIIYNKYLPIFVLSSALILILTTSYEYQLNPIIEISTISFLSVMIYFLDKYFKNFTQKDFNFLSVLFGIIISLNNRYIFHYCGFLTFLFILKYFEKRISLKHLISSIMIVFCILAPWHIRQYIVHGRFILFSPMHTKTFEQSKDQKKVFFEEQRRQMFEEYLLDSLNHPLKDNPTEREKIRKEYWDFKIAYTKNYEKRQKLYIDSVKKGLISKKTEIKQVIVFEPAKKQISDKPSNDLALVSNKTQELIGKREKILGIKPISISNGNNTKVPEEDNVQIVKYNEDGSIASDGNSINNVKNSNPNVGSGSIAYALNHRKGFKNKPDNSIAQYASNTTNNNDKKLKKKNKSIGQSKEQQEEPSSNTVTIAYINNDEKVITKYLSLSGTLNNSSKQINSAVQPENLISKNKEILAAIRSKDFVFLQRYGIIKDSLIFDSLNLEFAYSVLAPKAIDNIHLNDNKTLLVDNNSFSMLSLKEKNEILQKYNISKTEAENLLASSSSKVISEIKKPNIQSQIINVDKVKSIESQNKSTQNLQTKNTDLKNENKNLSQSENRTSKSESQNYESRLVFLDKEKYSKLSSKEKNEVLQKFNLSKTEAEKFIASSVVSSKLEPKNTEVQSQLVSKDKIINAESKTNQTIALNNRVTTKQENNLSLSQTQRTTGKQQLQPQESGTLLMDKQSFAMLSDKEKNEVLQKYNVSKTEAEKVIAMSSKDSKIMSNESLTPELKEKALKEQSIENVIIALNSRSTLKNEQAGLNQSDKKTSKFETQSNENKILLLDKEKYSKLSSKEKNEVLQKYNLSKTEAEKFIASSVVSSKLEPKNTEVQSQLVSKDKIINAESKTNQTIALNNRVTTKQETNLSLSQTQRTTGKQQLQPQESGTLLMDKQSFAMLSDKEKNEVLQKYNVSKTEAEKVIAMSSKDSKIKINESLSPELKEKALKEQSKENVIIALNSRSTLKNEQAGLNQSDQKTSKFETQSNENKILLLDKEKYSKLSSKEKNEVLQKYNISKTEAEKFIASSVVSSKLEPKSTEVQSQLVSKDKIINAESKKSIIAMNSKTNTKNFDVREINNELSKKQNATTTPTNSNKTNPQSQNPNSQKFAYAQDKGSTPNNKQEIQSKTNTTPLTNKIENNASKTISNPQISTDKNKIVLPKETNKKPQTPNTQAQQNLYYGPNPVSNTQNLTSKPHLPNKPQEVRIKIDTNIVIVKRVVPNEKKENKIITDTVVYIEKSEVPVGMVSINYTPSKPKRDTVKKERIAEFVETAGLEKKPQLLEFNDGENSIVMDGLKVKSVRIGDFENEKEFDKFELLRVQKAVPTYNSVIDQLLSRYPKYFQINNFQKILNTLTYAKYKEMVYEKPYPNKWSFIYYRLKQHFVFFRYDFSFQGDNDPRINVPSWFNNWISMILDLIIAPVILISIIPLIIAFYKKNYFIISMAALVILHIILHSYVGGAGRYRITIYPAWITFAFYGYDQITRYFIHVFKHRNEYKLRVYKILRRA